ncbi:TOMM precursor leader peptide-binding protein [Streptomyces sp. NPDC047028]|uniref:TOMM precursor leader peptide-binding protein n=1 Tax=Streptomyces sp. NPDC047028 TaxID=3155793 RepID=UPI0033E2183E
MGAPGGSDNTLLGFRPHLRVEHVPGEAVYVLTGSRATALHGRHIARLAPLLDGTRNMAELIRQTEGALGAEQTRSLVDRLRTAGLVTSRDPGDPGCPKGEPAYWETARLDGTQAARARTAATVRALSAGAARAVARSALHLALSDAGLTVTDADTAAGADLSIVLCDDYLDPALRAVDEEHREAGRPWLPVLVHGTEIHVGPFLGVPERACWSCLADRLWRGRQIEAHIQRALGRTGPLPGPDCALPAAIRSGLGLAALEAVKWLAGYRHPGQRSLWVLNTLTMESAHHPVPRRPQCASCGDPGLVAARVTGPLRLRRRTKTDTTGGGHRALTPDEFQARYGHLVDEVTGLVRDIRQDSRGPEFLNSFHAGLNPVTAPNGVAGLRTGLRATCGGKGTTALQARTGALAEALERCSGYFQGDEATVHGSYGSLAADAIHPDAVQLYDPRQFAGRAEWNATHAPAQQICDPLPEDAEIEWTPVWSLTERRHKLLPTAFLYYDVPQREGAAYCMGTSNGAAAGGTLEDAVLQGTLELIERDAVAQWWYNRLRLPGVDLDAFADDWTREMRSVHASLNRDVWALDLTSDLGVPVFAAVSRRTDKPAQDLMFGFGAHLDPRVALRRALTELNQLLPPVALAAPDGTGYDVRDPLTLDWLRTATTEHQPYVTADPARPFTTPDTHAYAPRADLLDDVEALRDLLGGHGLEMLVLDQTRPDVGLPVVKVVVPGLRPHWPRFAPGRLYDAPVARGLLREPTAYDDLNPYPLFV